MPYNPNVNSDQFNPDLPPPQAPVRPRQAMGFGGGLMNQRAGGVSNGFGLQGMGRTQARLGQGAGMMGSSRVGMGVGQAQRRYGGGTMPGYSQYQQGGNAVQQARAQGPDVAQIQAEMARRNVGAQLNANPQNSALAGYLMSPR